MKSIFKLISFIVLFILIVMLTHRLLKCIFYKKAELRRKDKSNTLLLNVYVKHIQYYSHKT